MCSTSLIADSKLGAGLFFFVFLFFSHLPNALQKWTDRAHMSYDQLVKDVLADETQYTRDLALIIKVRPVYALVLFVFYRV